MLYRMYANFCLFLLTISCILQSTQSSIQLSIEYRAKSDDEEEPPDSDVSCNSVPGVKELPYVYTESDGTIPGMTLPNCRHVTCDKGYNPYKRIVRTFECGLIMKKLRPNCTYGERPPNLPYPECCFPNVTCTDEGEKKDGKKKDGEKNSGENNSGEKKDEENNGGEEKDEENNGGEEKDEENNGGEEKDAEIDVDLFGERRCGKPGKDGRIPVCYQTGAKK